MESMRFLNDERDDWGNMMIGEGDRLLDFEQLLVKF